MDLNEPDAGPAVAAVATPPGADGRSTWVVALDDHRAESPELAGSKAAALARARRAGLATLDGFVITTAAVAAIDGGTAVEHLAGLRQAWADLTADGKRPAVVRSSSTVEDLGESSMAGVFESVVGVSGWPELERAIGEVLDSRRNAARAVDGLAPDHPIAVLVQPVVEAAAGGIMFGVDPVTGREDRVVVSAVEGLPESLVSGGVQGTRYELDLEAAVQSVEAREGGAHLTRRQLHELVAMSRAAGDTFGGPQDIEWAIDRSGELRLLQSRPVTTEARGRPQGPVLGPGPVAETFPEPLARLEEDLWLPPLRKALALVLELTGAAPPDEIDGSPLVVAVDGWVAIDLELTGEVPSQPAWRRRLDPRPRLRRIGAAWRMGRLREALPDLARDLIEEVDAELAAVPPLGELTDRQVVALIDRSQQALVALHGHELLMGMVIDPDAVGLTGASVALRVLAQARREGTPDDEILATNPAVLALVPPHVEPRPRLPRDVVEPPPSAGDRPSDRSEMGAAVLREALRMRVRWVQELMGRSAWELGARLVEAGLLPEPAAVRSLSLDDLEMVVQRRAVPLGLERNGDPAERRRDDAVEGARGPEPLPPCFRLSDTGRPILVRRGDSDGGGTGAGGGVATGTVTHDAGNPPSGSVLVVPHLSPDLAVVLPRLAGLVAETGSVLAHAAILARESGVATVVGVANARQRLPEGAVARVDGSNGDISVERKEGGA